MAKNKKHKFASMLEKFKFAIDEFKMDMDYTIGILPIYGRFKNQIHPGVKVSIRRSKIDRYGYANARLRSKKRCKPAIDKKVQRVNDSVATCFKSLGKISKQGTY